MYSKFESLSQEVAVY